MNRRDFLQTSVAATAAAMGAGWLLPSCTRNLRMDLRMEGMDMNPVPGQVSPEAGKILYYASLAPSGHNSQPWFVQMVTENEWIIGSDARRWLPQVDGFNRGVILSLGAFGENMVQAAAVYGLHAEVEVIAQDRFDPRVARVNLSSTPPAQIPLERLIFRRTVKSHFQDRELSSAHVKTFSKAVPGHLHYFPLGSRHSDLMAAQAIENFKIQFENQKTMEEAAAWTRLSDWDALKFRDGLTPAGMEISGVAGWVVRHFMDPGDVTGKAFRQKGIQKVMTQAREGGGWMVITSSGTSVKALFECGRQFQRMALVAREKMIAIHPMTQTLEEKQGRETIEKHHDSSMIPQFMLRVGYLKKYPDPVSLRRPVSWFLKG